MIDSEYRKEVLAHAHALMGRNAYVDAIAWLRNACHEQPDFQFQKLLAQCRYRAYAVAPPLALVDEAWSLSIEDPFASIAGIPEIEAEQLNPLTLTAGIRCHGALLVRGLLDPSRASDWASGIEQTLQDCHAWPPEQRDAVETPWYSRLALKDNYGLGFARNWIEGAGGVWAADSPRLLYELIEFFETSGVLGAITGYFDERPMLSVGKSTLRRVPANQGIADWHQDGAFMGTDIRSVNVWLSLSHCGDDASGLDLLPQRLSGLLPTGTHDAFFDWSVGPGMVDQAAAGVATVSPIFRPGDALLFDHFFLHRTGVPAGICRPRYAIESWFFAPSAYPAAQVPLWL